MIEINQRSNHYQDLLINDIIPIKGIKRCKSGESSKFFDDEELVQSEDVIDEN